MSQPVNLPAGWKIRQVPWLEPGTVVDFSGRDLAQDAEVSTDLTVGATLGRGGQAAVFSISMSPDVAGQWGNDEVVLRVSYQDDEYGRDPRRTSIYQQLARLRLADSRNDPLEGLLRLHAVGHLPPPDYLPGQDLWAQVLDRGGSTLAQWIAGNHPHGLGPSDGVAVMLPILQALAVCHMEGIVHRDIKPGNVFVTERAPVPPPAGLDGPRATGLFDAGLAFLRLGDLGSMTHLSAAGMARLQARAAPEVLAGEELDGEIDGLTHTFTTNIDTGPFTPPEVWSSAAQSEADPAGDVWQLAVTLYYACTGELPFQGWRGREWATQRPRYVQATQEGEPNSEMFEELPGRLQYLLRWCLTPDPLDRPDLSSLVDELVALDDAPAVDVPAPPHESAPDHEMLVEGSDDEGGDQTGENNEFPLTEVSLTAPVAGSARTGGSDRVAFLHNPDDLHDLDSPHDPGPTSDPAPSPDAGPSHDPDQGLRSGRLGVFSHHSRLLLVAATVVVALVVAGLLLNGMRGRTEKPPITAPVATIPQAPRLTKDVLHDDTGRNLAEVLPQLFSDTPLAKRANLGTLQERSYQFCDPCVDNGLRLRVSVSVRSAETLTVNTPPQAQPVGPYLVLVTPKSQQFPANPLAADRIRTYPLASRFASTRYQQVVLIPVNRIGEGDGPTRGDTSWQTRVQSNGVQQLTFDIPGQVVYVTVLWFNARGVVGFNWFEDRHQRATIENP